MTEESINRQSILRENVPSFRIPDQEIPKLKELAELSEDKFRALISAITATKPTLTGLQFEESLTKRLPDFGDLFPILSLVLSLYWLKENEKVPAKELADGISKAAAESKLDKIKFPKEKQGLLQARLEALLGFDASLGVTAKATDVMTEHANVFCGARILSDLRPVFTSTPESASGAVIIHNLQIGFHSQGKHKEFYVAMDTGDIEKLKQVIARAEKKTEALKGIIEKANIPYLEV